MRFWRYNNAFSIAESFYITVNYPHKSQSTPTELYHTIEKKKLADDIVCQ